MRVFAHTSLGKSSYRTSQRNHLPKYAAYRYAEDLRSVARCRPAAFSARRAGDAGFLGVWRAGANVACAAKNAQGRGRIARQQRDCFTGIERGGFEHGAAAQVFEFIGLHD